MIRRGLAVTITGLVAALVAASVAVALVRVKAPWYYETTTGQNLDQLMKGTYLGGIIGMHTSSATQIDGAIVTYFCSAKPHQRESIAYAKTITGFQPWTIHGGHFTLKWTGPWANVSGGAPPTGATNTVKVTGTLLGSESPANAGFYYLAHGSVQVSSNGGCHVSTSYRQLQAQHRVSNLASDVQFQW